MWIEHVPRSLMSTASSVGATDLLTRHKNKPNGLPAPSTPVVKTTVSPVVFSMMILPFLTHEMLETGG